MHGLMTELAQHHDLTAVVLVDEEFDIEECRRAMQVYCHEVVLIPNPSRGGASKRLQQLRSLTSTQSFERLRVRVPALQQALDRVLRARPFDVVNLEFTFLGATICVKLRPGTGCRRWLWTLTTSTTTWPGSTPALAASSAACTRRPIGESCGGRN